jgi:hypothetical protein
VILANLLRHSSWLYHMDVSERNPELMKYRQGWLRRDGWPYLKNRGWPYLPAPGEIWNSYV